MTSNAPYPTFRSGPERLALALVLLVLVGLPLAALGYQRLLQPLLAPADVRVIELTARLPTAAHGGWTPGVIVVEKGERVRLRLTSADVVHGLAIPKLGVDAGWVEPGKVTEIEFVAEQAGRYTFLCTIWCLEGHWRMRGVLEVVDPDDPMAVFRDVSPPQTDWMAAGLDIDAPHPGQAAPAARPSASRGAALWADIGEQSPGDLLPASELRTLTPADVYLWLTGEDLAVDLTAAERWDFVAYAWYEASSPEMLAAGRRLYERDCTGCHGPSGGGDGPGASALLHLEPGHEDMALPATDFTDLAAQAGASDLLYYGKLVRGGMGTSMPYWGTVYTEEELWAVIAYLRSFAFDYPWPEP